MITIMFREKIKLGNFWRSEKRKLMFDKTNTHCCFYPTGTKGKDKDVQRDPSQSFACSLKVHLK